MTSVYELAWQVNFRLYDGDESKFPVLLAIIGEIQYRSFGCLVNLFWEGCATNIYLGRLDYIVGVNWM